MATLERYLAALIDLQQKTALESLDPNRNAQTEFRYGQVCGIQQGLKMAEELLNSQLNEDEDGDTDQGGKRTRRTR